MLPAPHSLFGGAAATALLGRAASAASDAGSLCIRRPESISIKRGPAALCAAGNKRERAAGAVQERTRQGDNRGISAEMQCGTASRAARDFTGEPCSPVNPFFLDGGFWLGESASRKPGGGVGGAFLLQEGQMASKPPTIFLWYRQAAPSLSKKEMVGPTVLPPGGRNLPSRAVRGTSFPCVGSRPPPAGEIPLSSDSGKTIPQAAFTQGGLYGAALPQRKKRPFGRSPRVCAESRTAGAAFTPPSRTGLRPAFPGRRGCFRPPECAAGRCGCDKRRGRP